MAGVIFLNLKLHDMEYKQLEKASKIYDRIKAIDAEIIEIDRMAVELSELDSDVDFSITLPAKQKEEKQEPQEGDIEQVYRYVFLSGIMNKDVKKEKTGTAISKKIQPTTALQMLGVLLCCKNEERKALVSKLSKLGIATH